MSAVFVGQMVRVPDLRVIRTDDGPTQELYEVVGFGESAGRVTIRVDIPSAPPLDLTVPASWCQPVTEPLRYVVTDGFSWVVDPDGYPTMTTERTHARKFTLDQACGVLRLLVETSATAGYGTAAWTLEVAP